MQFDNESFLDSLTPFWIVINDQGTILSCSQYFEHKIKQSQKLTSIFQFNETLEDNDLFKTLKDKKFKLSIEKPSVQFNANLHINHNQALLIMWPEFHNPKEITFHNLETELSHPVARMNDIIIDNDIVSHNSKVLIENMLEGMIVRNSKGLVVEFNPAALDILEVSKEELLAHNSQNLIWKTYKEDGTEYLPKDYPTTISLEKQEVIKNIVMGIKVRNKSIKWIKVNTSPIIKEGENLVIATFQDITRQKKLEKELIDSNHYLELALEEAGIGVWTKDLSTNTIVFDKRSTGILGEEGDIFKIDLDTWEKRIHPEDQKNYNDLFIKIKDDDTQTYETIHKIKHASGKWICLLEKGKVSVIDFQGKVVKITGTILDITETANIQEEELAELKDIFSSTPSCLKIIDSEGHLKYMNEQGLNIIGAYNFQEVFDKSIYDLIDTNFRNDYIEFNKKVCAGEKSSMSFEIIRLDGEKRWMETYAAPHRMPDGSVGHIAITNDITQKISDERELENQKNIAAHSAKLASLGELAAGVGHEINNPMTVVKGHVGFLSKFINEKDFDIEKMDSSIKKINIAIERVTNIVGGLKTFSRSEDEELASVDLSNMIRSSVELIHDIYEKESISFQLYIEDNLFTFGNLGRLQQVILNLFTNSKDSMTGHNKKIIVIAKRENHLIKLWVKDNGNGIPKEIINNIFDPFFSSKGVNEGTGIGLSISHQIITEHGGTIEVEETGTEGTCFLITLKAGIPVHPSPFESNLEVVKNEGDKSENEDRPLRILVAEDEQDIRELLEIMIEAFGHEVTTAENGEEAWEIYQKEADSIDIVITDIQMPKMNGIELMQSIRSSSHPDVPCLVITGGVNINFSDQESEVYKLIDGHIEKPFEESTIRLKIQELTED